MNRVRRSTPSILQNDGVHMRRMWMMNNPVVVVRAALDPGTRLTNRRIEDDLTLVDLQLKEGDKSRLHCRQSNLPAWVRWSDPHNDLGQVTFTTHFTGYAPFGGVLLRSGSRPTRLAQYRLPQDLCRQL